MRSVPEITVPLHVDAALRDPLPVQLVGQFRTLIADAVLAPGDAVPSSRALATYLGVSRGSVVAAYDQLLAEGYLSAAAGRSTVVNPQLLRVHPRPARHSRPAPRDPLPELDLRPGQPWTGDVTGPAWRAAWRRASALPVVPSVPPLGLPELRDSWSEHLRRMRAVVCDPGRIAVTSGGREGLSLLLLALGRQVGRPLRVGVEDPGYPSLRRVPPRYGATIVPVAVDDHGLRVDDLPSGPDVPDLLLVTPSHQYPLGGSLPADRRQILLEWARQNQVVIVEDDYDSELRYTSQPLPALAALDDPADGRVVLLGTLSKILTPALAVGFLALPDWLVPAVADTRRELGQPVGLVAQRAVADYLGSGALRLHTQRMRNRYRRLRARVVAELSGVPGLHVHPMDGGLHAVVESSRPTGEVVAELAAAGVWVSPLSEYWAGTGTRQGIVFGFGAVSEEDLVRGLRLIAAAMASTGSTIVSTGSTGVATGSATVSTGSTGVATGSATVSTGSTGVATGSATVSTGSTGVSTGSTGVATDSTVAPISGP
ncbi:MocR-like pyridoxine biosynthesis transcription factor PdxR [Brooklawnia cerclae]|uniref:GntR family transcriptional regulator/MocR family aminotransferase n=1 Tax=Brooklawnia cerclae TaxID=349934 RepID=A0ABX0SBB1_9ACTN|nr:aminotransferase class I/II-fold pyridoxal phosphate-dependent enzyme [Brooklawnia cerclae]NIH55677.1 GntR family transcriptional regulator/MocR family aminotransferase [Brooklawnia cerclae]